MKFTCGRSRRDPPLRAMPDEADYSSIDSARVSPGRHFEAIRAGAWTPTLDSTAHASLRHEVAALPVLLLRDARGRRDDMTRQLQCARDRLPEDKRGRRYSRSGMPRWVTLASLECPTPDPWLSNGRYQVPHVRCIAERSTIAHAEPMPRWSEVAADHDPRREQLRSSSLSRPSSGRDGRRISCTPRFLRWLSRSSTANSSSGWSRPRRRATS